MRIGFHIHSEYSHDYNQSIQSILEEAKRLKFDAISITDHNTVRGSLEAKKQAHGEVKIIIGAELSTTHGHVLVKFKENKK